MANNSIITASNSNANNITDQRNLLTR